MLVRQTIDDTLHEALDVDGVRDAARAHRGRRGRGALRATPPSRRCSRTRSSPRGRTRSSTTRSSRTGAPTRSPAARAAGRPRVDRRARARRHRAGARRDHARARRPPTTCTTCLCSLVLTPRPRRLAPAVGRAASTRGRGRCSATPASSCGATTESRDDARATRSPATTTRSPRPLRGHLEIPGITTVDALAAATTLAARDGVAVGLAVLEQRGLRAAGPLHAPRRQPSTEWVARRLLARMHSLLAARAAQVVRAGHRAGLHALPAALAARRARHASSPAKPAWSRCSSSSRATRPPRSPGSPSCSRAGCATTSPAWLDRALPRRRGRAGCGSRRAPATTPTRRPARRRRRRRSRSCSAPTSRWLLDAAARRRSRREPTVGATAEVARGAARARRVLRRRARRRRPAGCPTTSSARCGTASPAACSRPTASARSAPA